MYKRKADKVRPVDNALSDGSTPGGFPNWRERALARLTPPVPQPYFGPFDHLLEPRYSDEPVGFRLTPARLKDVIVGIDLHPNEEVFFHAMLKKREPAMAWNFSDLGRLSEEVMPAVKVRTVPHEAWQAPTYPVPRAVRPELVKMLQERVKAGIMEECYGAYRNPWFLVKKKSGTHRFINSAVHMNAVTLRDALIPPNVDEFAEDIAGRPLVSLVDIFSGYDNISSHPESRDMTAVMTPLGLLRQTTLLQGATNSPAQFIRGILKVLYRHLHEKASPYVDDVSVKSSRTASMVKEVLPGVREAVYEHILRLDGVLADIELAGMTIAGAKSHFLSQRLEVVGYECGPEGRWPAQSKVAAIIEWSDCRSVKDARGFLGVCTYYRIFIFEYALIAEPIFRLLKKDVAFVWTDEQRAAMDKLKIALTTAPALIPIDYESGREIIVMVDASGKGFGIALMQIGEDSHRHPVRYDSGLWTPAERKYDAVKLECRGLLHALKKLRPYIYGVQFTVETDANTLVAQLNQTATDLPNALVTRWLAWIQMFDFDVRHVPGKKNAVADALSRKESGPTPNDDEDLDDWVDAHLDCVQAFVQPVDLARDDDIQGGEGLRPLDETYSVESQEIALWLVTLRRPPGMTRREFRNFKRSAVKYVVIGRQLFRKQSKNMPLVRVVDGETHREQLIKELHDESGHRGREGTYRKIADRYCWDGLFDDVTGYVRTCKVCQLLARDRREEAMHPSWTPVVGRKWAVDVVKMPTAAGFVCLVLAREDVSGWVEGRALRAPKSRHVARFLFEEIICRFGCFELLVNDGGPENERWTEILLELYGIKNVRISAYHPMANGMIERGHPQIVTALAKISSVTGRPWPEHLHAVLWADRTTVKVPTGMTPAHVVYGRDHVLPIELQFPTWGTAKWSSITNTEDLLAARAAQLDRRDEDLEEARLRLRRHREWNKEYFDDNHRIRSEELAAGDLVLVWDSTRDKDMSNNRKFAPRWRGPFRIQSVAEGMGSYRLEELDGAVHSRTYPGRLLKHFHPRENDAELVPRRESVRVIIPPQPENLTEYMDLGSDVEQAPPLGASGDQEVRRRKVVRVELPQVPWDPDDYLFFGDEGFEEDA